MTDDNGSIHDTGWWERIIARIKQLARDKGATDEELTEARRLGEADANDA